MSEKVCPNCGTKTNKKFCPECGTELVKEDKKTERKCPKCGAVSTTKFCPECGTQIMVEKKEKTCPKCGAVTTANFCGECGYSFNQDNATANITVNTNNSEQNNSKTSMILGIISCGCLFFGWSSIASIVLGVIGLKKAKEENPGGEKTAGYVLSLIGVIGGIIELIYCVICLLFLGQFTTTFFNIFNSTMNQYNDALNSLQ